MAVSDLTMAGIDPLIVGIDLLVDENNKQFEVNISVAWYLQIVAKMDSTLGEMNDKQKYIQGPEVSGLDANESTRANK